MEFEILISTMYRNNMDFLEEMFARVGGPRFPVLIVNQTDPENQLKSESEHIRVINSSSRGLSQSRNLAIAHAKGKVCLVADDDVTYLPGFEEVILRAHQRQQEAVVITFKMLDQAGREFRSYPDHTEHDLSTIGTVNGVVISFKREPLLQAGIVYNRHFGLGCTFQSANEYVFMRNVLKSGVRALFEPQPILEHPEISSGRDEGSDRVVYARAALRYKYFGFWSYLWVIKYVRFLWAQGYIQLKQFRQKLKVGYAGISAYRDLLRNGSEIR